MAKITKPSNKPKPKPSLSARLHSTASSAGKRRTPHECGKASALLRQVSHPSRLQIILLLEAEGELPVAEIRERIHQGEAVVSHHLALLRQSRIVSAQHHGKSRVYDLTKAGVHLVNSLHGLVYLNTVNPVRTADRPKTRSSAGETKGSENRRTPCENRDGRSRPRSVAQRAKRAIRR